MVSFTGSGLGTYEVFYDLGYLGVIWEISAVIGSFGSTVLQ